MKKPGTELIVCASALLELDLSVSVSLIEELIAEGYRHLEELQATAKCNPLLISSLGHRLNRAESILEQKKRQEEQAERAMTHNRLK